MTQVAIYTGQEAIDQERLKLLGEYHPKEHLIIIPTKQGQKPYYPAAWRLYELSIRYTDANFKSEIVFMDVDKDIVIVKAYLFLGPDYVTSVKKAEAFKQGKLSMLDKVETAAKARAARDFGISTELALDMEDATVDDSGEVTSTIARSTIINEERTVEAAAPRGNNTSVIPLPAALRARCRTINKNFDILVKSVFKQEISDEDLNPDHCSKLNEMLKQWEQAAKKAAANTNGK